MVEIFIFINIYILWVTSKVQSCSFRMGRIDHHSWAKEVSYWVKVALPQAQRGTLTNLNKASLFDRTEFTNYGSTEVNKSGQHSSKSLYPYMFMALLKDRPLICNPSPNIFPTIPSKRVTSLTPLTGYNQSYCHACVLIRMKISPATP